MRFIGEDGYYPDWAKGKGRWIIQRVFTTAGSFMERIDVLAKPEVADEWVIWAPPMGGINNLVAMFNGAAEAWRALYELQYIPFICRAEHDGYKCNWSGYRPSIILSSSSVRPASWRLRCPKCYSVIVPNIFDLNSNVILERWKSLKKPKLDNPAAARMIVSVNPIHNLEKWLTEFRPMEVELAYVAQQLWPNLAYFLKDAGSCTK